MTENIQKIIEKISENNPNWKMLYRKLRINDKIVNPKKKIIVSSLYNYQNANLIQRIDKKIYWTAITVVGNTPQVEFQSRAKFDIQGNFIDGIMNTFSFGMMDMDIEVIREYFYEVHDKFSSSEYWDVISNKNNKAILKKFNIPKWILRK